MTTTQGTRSGSKGIARLFGALAVASGTSVALPSCATDAPEPETTNQSGDALTCGGVVCPADSGTCGNWSCALLTKACSFKAAAAEGDACVAANNDRGKCVGVGDGGRTGPSYLMCCTGCFTGKVGLDIACHPGGEVGYCGTDGLKCDACTQCETCSGGACQPTSGGACGTCQVCNAGSCDPRAVGATCAGGHCAAGNTCCTGNACINGTSCVATDDAHCGADGNQCSDCGQCGACSGGACQPTSGACDDGDPCTENDMCDGAGGCAGTPIDVDDNNPCTTDDCTAAAGETHVSLMEGASCPDDGSSCTSGERCTDADMDPLTPRVCLPATGTMCFDENPCTSDAPDCMTGGCPYDPETDGTACSANDRCILNESCQGGACTGEDRNCNDDNPCTTDSCEPDVADPDADPLTGCKHVARTATCDDGNPCTQADACDAGTCAGTPKTCTPFDECHGVGSCDPGTGQCTDPQLIDGSGCENTGTCASGRCMGGTPTASGGSAGSAGNGTGGSTGGTGQGGEAGDGTAATAGDESGGSSGSAGRGGNAGRGGSGSGATGGNGGGKFTGPTFVRDPGGCSCEVPGQAPTKGGYLGVVLAGALAFLTRKRRRAA